MTDTKDWDAARWFTELAHAPENLARWAPVSDTGWALQDPKKKPLVWILAEDVSWRVGIDDGLHVHGDPAELDGVYPWNEKRSEAFTHALDAAQSLAADASLTIVGGPEGPGPYLRTPPQLSGLWEPMPRNMQADLRIARMRALPSRLIACLVERVTRGPTCASRDFRWRATVYPGQDRPTVSYHPNAAAAIGKTDKVLTRRFYSAADPMSSTLMAKKLDALSSEKMDDNKNKK